MRFDLINSKVLNTSNSRFENNFAVAFQHDLSLSLYISSESGCFALRSDAIPDAVPYFAEDHQ